MNERLRTYEDGRLSLRGLVADLEFLLGALEALDDTARQELRDLWGVLEEVYSVSLADRERKVDQQGEALVRATVASLRERVGRLLAAPA